MQRALPSLIGRRLALNVGNARLNLGNFLGPNEGRWKIEASETLLTTVVMPSVGFVDEITAQSQTVGDFNTHAVEKSTVEVLVKSNCGGVISSVVFCRMGSRSQRGTMLHARAVISRRSRQHLETIQPFRFQS